MSEAEFITRYGHQLDFENPFSDFDDENTEDDEYSDDSTPPESIGDQNENDEYRECVQCLNNKPRDAFVWHPRYRGGGTRPLLSTRCATCRGINKDQRNLQRSRQRVLNGTGVPVVINLSWNELVAYFERDMPQFIEYAPNVSYSFIRDAFTRHNSTYFVIDDIYAPFA